MTAFPQALHLTATSLAVVAPHPDDDVLGCGALIARVAPHMRVRVIYVTDGAASHDGSPSYPPQRLRDVREAEARRALRRLGVRAAPLFLRWPDGTVPAADDANAAAPLLASLRRAIPAGDDVAVAVPWRRDPHCDHRAVTSLVDAVLRERPRATRLEYAVWVGIIGEAADEPIPAEGLTVEVDSRRWLAKKRAALREHRSQLGGLITDATRAFELPEALLARALGPVERFVIAGTAALMESLSKEYFERLYTSAEDPWSFATSAYEAEKYGRSLAALEAHYVRGLEIGCSIGVFTERLAPRCDELIAIDISELALARARNRCEHLPQVSFERMTFPHEAPPPGFDLITCCEVGYYWSDEDLTAARERIAASLVPDGDLLLVHWLPHVDEYVREGDAVHAAFLADDRYRHVDRFRAERYRLDLLRRR